MVTVKKLLTASLMAVAIGTSANAYEVVKTPVWYIQPEAGIMEIGDTSDTTYGLSFGGGFTSETFDFYGDIGIRSSSVDSSSSDSGDYEVSAGLSVGYNVYKGIRPYVNVGYTVISDFGGYTYGVGVNYEIIKHIGVNASYKQGSVDLGYGPSYDYSEALVGLRFDFEASR